MRLSAVAVALLCSACVGEVAPSSMTVQTTAIVSTVPSAAVGTPSDEQFGFTVYGGGRAVVRSEMADTEISSFTLDTPSFSSPAISPDGRSVAYWAPARGTPVLHVRSVTGGTARGVLTGTSGQIAGRVAWSPDGTGLAAALQSEGQEIGGGDTFNELWTIDLAGGATEMIARGKIWVPLAWDRSAKVVAAGVTGPGGYATDYDLISLAQKPYAVRLTALAFAQSLIGGLKASTDARYVFLMNFAGTTITWWPLAQPEKASTIAEEALRAEWRPGTSEIWWVGGLTPAGCRVAPCAGTEVISFDVATGARAVAFRGSVGPYLAGFRVDGSAAITASYGSGPTPGSNASDLTFVEIATGRLTRIGVGGAFGAPVRLR